MEIVNPLDHGSRDIKTPLQRMIAGNDPIQAMRGRLLLDVVRWLEDLPGPRAVGNIILNELILCAGSRSVVRIGVDWYDYGPLRDGPPVAHFLVWVKNSKVALSEETRASNAEEAARAVTRALTEDLDNGDKA